MREMSLRNWRTGQLGLFFALSEGVAIYLRVHYFSLLDVEAPRFAIRAGERDLKRERFDGNNLVVLCRGTRSVADGAVEDDGVLLGPQEFDDLLQLMLLAEERPPKQFEFPLRRIDRILFDGDDGLALANENVLAWVEEIF